MVTLQVKLSNNEHITLDEAAIAEFKAGMRGEVLTPQSADYDEVRILSNRDTQQASRTHRTLYGCRRCHCCGCP